MRICFLKLAFEKFCIVHVVNLKIMSQLFEVIAYSSERKISLLSIVETMNFVELLLIVMTISESVIRKSWTRNW